MKKQFYLTAFGFLFCLQLIAQCPDGVAINSITKPSSCTSADGKFNIEVRPTQNPGLYENGFVRVGNTDTVWTRMTSDNYNVTGKTAGTYLVIVRNYATKAICTQRLFVLQSDYKTGFTDVSSPATACNVANGKIVLGGVAATDSVSWISSFTPAFSVVSSLTSNTIPNLKPGLYYIIIKSPNGSQCFSLDTTLVATTSPATACPAATLCTNSYGPNKFPNGTFGAGAALNGPALPTGETNYGYTQLGHYGPDDGFYSIVKTTDYDSTAGSGKVFDTWLVTTDHTGDANGYMMVVNASYDKDIVTEKTITGLCPNKTYQFSAYIKSLHPTGNILPNLSFLIDGIGKYRTGNIANNSGWVSIGFTFKSTGTSAVFSIRNNNGGGTGNDWVIDDIVVGVCTPTITMNPVVTTCINPANSLTATITDASKLYSKYKWQVNKLDGNGFVDVNPGSSTGVFDINTNQYTATVTPNPSPITEFQNGWTYRIIVAEDDGDFAVSDCSYTNVKTLIIAQCGAVLPVKISSLKAELNNTIGEILWHVEEQTNIKQYQLEKSADGINFNYLKTIAVGTSNNYSVEDNTLDNGINYYRIKAINNDGKYTYSTIVTLALKGNTDAIKIFPNPVKDRLFVWMPTDTKIKGFIILDAIGQKVIEKSGSNTSTNVSDIEVSKLLKGVYNIQIHTNKNEVKNFSFIKR